MIKGIGPIYAKGRNEPKVSSPPGRIKVLVITGGPGVGTTTLVSSILNILRVEAVNVALAIGRPGGEAAVGEHRLRGEDDPSASGSRSRTRRLPPSHASVVGAAAEFRSDTVE